MSRAVKRVADVCGIHMTAQMLRHYLATTLISGNVAPNTVAAILGHADASVTLRIYTDAPDLDKRRDAMEMIDAEMSKQSLTAGK